MYLSGITENARLSEIRSCYVTNTKQLLHYVHSLSGLGILTGHGGIAFAISGLGLATLAGWLEMEG